MHRFQAANPTSLSPQILLDHIKMSTSKGKKRQVSETAMEEAVDAVRKKIFPTAYAAEKRYGVSKTTIPSRQKGKTKRRREAHEDEQLLSKEEKGALVKWCQELTRAGFPLLHAWLREMVQEIQYSRTASVNTPGGALVSYPPIGIHWTQRFLQCHPDLKSVFCRQLELARWTHSTRRTVEKWFRAFRKATKGILLGNIYNMDETGFLIGILARAQVIIDASTCTTPYRTHPGRQEWVSVLECICANGTTV